MFKGSTEYIVHKRLFSRTTILKGYCLLSACMIMFKGSKVRARMNFLGHDIEVKQELQKTQANDETTQPSPWSCVQERGSMSLALTVSLPQHAACERTHMPILWSQHSSLYRCLLCCGWEYISRFLACHSCLVSRCENARHCLCCRCLSFHYVLRVRCLTQFYVLRWDVAHEKAQKDTKVDDFWSSNFTVHSDMKHVFKPYDLLDAHAVC